MNTTDKLIFPNAVAQVVGQLNSNGFEAFLVGGCVRDSILSRVPYDWDITTNALPEQIKNIFERTYDTGIKHGTVSVAVENEFVEVTTYRVDGVYSDFRRPDKVEFTGALKEDLARRDFTINALAYHPQTGIVDFFGGIEDLAAGRIKTVGDPEQRFSEDALRMLRAVRFAAQLGFDLTAETFQAIKRNAKLIGNISQERVRDELNKLLMSEKPDLFSLLYDTQLLNFIMPEFIKCFRTEQKNPYHVYDVARHILTSMKNIECNRILRWTMLLHDIGKPSKKTTDEKGIDHFYGHQAVSAELAKVILSRLRFDKESIHKIVTLILYHDLDLLDSEKSVRKAICKVGEELLPDLVKVQKADALAQNKEFLGDRIEKLDNVLKIYHEIKSKNQCISKKNLAVNGDDLIALGMQQDKNMKKMLDYLFESVLENPALNEKQILLDMARKAKS